MGGFALALLGTLWSLAVLGPVPPALADASRSHDRTSPSASLSAGASTVVSFTFTGGYNGQEVAAQILAERGMAGTFYVNSGYLGFPAYLDLGQLRQIVRSGGEVAGASVDGQDLALMSADQVRSRVCDDRATLAALGFPVTSFAYPRGSWSYAAQLAARSCGYNSARGLAGLRASTTCHACPVSETLPARNVYAIRTAPTGGTLADLRGLVTRTERAGGGWIPLTFRYVCVCPEKGSDAVTPTTFASFVDWIATRPATTRVRTVDQVVGGPLNASHGSPLERLVPRPPAKRVEVPPSVVPAWELLGVRVGQPQIIFTGLLIALVVVLTYRAATRAIRHGQ